MNATNRSAFVQNRFSRLVLVLTAVFCIQGCILTNPAVPPKDGIKGVDARELIDQAETNAFLIGFRLIKEEIESRYGSAFADSFFSSYSEADLVAFRFIGRFFPDFFGVSAEIEDDEYYTRSSVDACVYQYHIMGSYLFKDLFMSAFNRAVSSNFSATDVLNAGPLMIILVATTCDLRKTGKVIHAGDRLSF